MTLAGVLCEAQGGNTLDLVIRAKARDREAFEMLVEKHATETFRIAAAIVGPADAADVTQETFVAAWQSLPKLRDTDAFAPWVRRICVNRSRNWLRTRARRPRAAMAFDEPGTPAMSDHGADFRVAAEARAVLEPAFESLTPDQRAVLALHYSMGLSITDAADTRSASESAPAVSIATGLLDGEVDAWQALIGDGTGAVSVTREGDGGATWTLIGPFRDATATYEWHIAAAGHLSSWSAELIEVTPSVEDTSFVTSHHTNFTPLARPEPIEPPAVDSPPDPASLGMPPDFPLQERSEP